MKKFVRFVQLTMYSLVATLCVITFVTSNTLAQSSEDYRSYYKYAEDKNNFIRKASDPAANYNSIEDYSAFVQASVPPILADIDLAVFELNTTNIPADRETALALQKSKSAFSAYLEASKTNDATKIDAAGDVLNTALENEHAVYAKYASASPQLTSDITFRLYAALFIFSIAVSIVIYLWSKKPVTSALLTEHAEAGAKLAMTHKANLAKSSLLPAFGAAITLGWYSYAYQNGGMYFIMWGPVVIGYVALARSFYAYRIDRALGNHEKRAQRNAELRSSMKSSYVFGIFITNGLRAKLVPAELTIDTVSGQITISSANRQPRMIPLKMIRMMSFVSNTIFLRLSTGKNLPLYASAQRGSLGKPVKRSDLSADQVQTLDQVRDILTALGVATRP